MYFPFSVVYLMHCSLVFPLRLRDKSRHHFQLLNTVGFAWKQHQENDWPTFEFVVSQFMAKASCYWPLLIFMTRVDIIISISMQISEPLYLKLLFPFSPPLFFFLLHGDFNKCGILLWNFLISLSQMSNSKQSMNSQ